MQRRGSRRMRANALARKMNPLLPDYLADKFSTNEQIMFHFCLKTALVVVVVVVVAILFKLLHIQYTKYMIQLCDICKLMSIQFEVFNRAMEIKDAMSHR